MPSMYIQANRQEINKSFGVAGFTVRTGLSPSWFEVVVTTDWRLLQRDARPHRTASNFFSSRGQGPLPAPGGEAVYLLPPTVLSRFAGQEKLYYTIAAFPGPDWRNPRVTIPPGEGMPYIRISKSFTGQALRQMIGVPNTRGGLTGNDYSAASPESLIWAGDEAVAGHMEPLAQMPTIASPGAKPTGGAAALAYGAGPIPGRAPGYSRTAEADVAYDDGFGAWPAAPAAALTTDIPLDPGTGGQSIGLDALAIGDIILSTTDARISAWIRGATGSQVSHTMIYTGDGGQVVEAVGAGVTFRPLAEALAEATVAVAFRVPNLTETQALMVRDYVGQQIGRPYNYWGIVRQALFQLDRATQCRNKTGEDLDRCVNWVGRVNLGTADNESFFCSQLVLAAYQAAGVPLTSTPPNWASPEDLAELRLSGRLGYVGHLKAPPLAAGAALGLATHNGHGHAAPGAGDRYSTARVHPFGGEQSFDVNWNDCQLVPQPTGMSCWAGAAAMVVGWRDRMSLTPETIAALIARTTATGLNPSNRRDLATAWGLVMEPPQSYSIEGFRQLLETNGPLWVGVAVPSGHAVVVTGIYGDGTPDGTTLRINDPWPPGQGAQITESFRQFAQEYENRLTTDAAGNVNVQVLHGNGRRPTTSTGASLAYGRDPTPTAAKHTPAKHAHSLGGPGSFDLNWSETELVPQLSNLTCWAAAAAMVIGWRDRVSIDPAEVARGGGLWQRYHDNWVIPYASIGDFGRALGLEVEPPQSYALAGFRQLLEAKGPLWVSAVTPMDHVIVVTGMSSDGNPDGSDTFVRILDPWGRGPGSPNVPGAYNPTPGQGSRYTLSWPEFVRQYEAAITTTPSGTVNIQILHASGTDGRSPYATAQSYGTAPPRRARTGAALQAAQLIPIAATVAGTVMTRVLNNEGDITWELDQMRGLKHPGDNPANAGSDSFTDITTSVEGPRWASVFGMDEIYADFELRWQYNGHSLGNIQIVNVRTNDAVGWGLQVKANIMDDANTYTTVPPSAARYAAIRVHFGYRFTSPIYADAIAETDFVLYGNGTIKRTSRWTQD